MAYGNEFIKKIYFNSPSFIKNIFASIYGYKAKKARYGQYYHKWLNYLEKSQYITNEELIKIRDEYTIDFVNEVLMSNEFYSRKYKIQKIASVSEINNFDLLEKNKVRENLNILIDKRFNNVITSHSSGTTGSAIIFPLTIECFQREYAFRSMHYIWSGVDLRRKPKIATFSGHPVASPNSKKSPFWAYDFVNNWLLFSSYHLSDDLVRYYIEKLVKFNPVLIHGYPSSVYLISLAFKKYGKELSNLKSIYTASETLMDFQRKAIEEAFQVKVYNWYGNSEMCANIVECEKG
ncbi:MAG: hypothetical protein N3A61_01245, partial [Ignavibacteria bacterium]|nr:hypothetical protein [Ignavibacteria bacterium]